MTSTDDDRPPVLDRLRMPDTVLRALACPVCGAGLEPGGNGLACTGGHRFDVAREGYAGLLTGHRPAGTGDTKDMVRARQEFQAAGHYAPLAARLAELAAPLLEQRSLAVDVGAGTGYYLAAVLEEAPRARGLALDVSKFALRRAARAHPRAGAAACDTWRGLPLRSGSADLLLDVFAPRAGAEFRRVLDAEGALIVVTPTARHLRGLVDDLGLVTVDARKRERVEGGLEPHFTREHSEELDLALSLAPGEAEALIAMGPSARHLAPGEITERVAALGGPVAATASFAVSLYRPSPKR
ncbi:putative RNA methyltransferase [Streptomonospora litoralis]|uniref:23S rRNA (Guanine(748)-N(1))-methyltransferase n=1 Tax=Streptomonospora litoralis TaxID=2498135 RepID=A0A4P6Q1N2_9ACTN|nr:methyltransferase domain-containing protein [Streptomonospora litoralis]QBI54546.1 23S rRNA (guanine(748)-N(1))-methyltransferase [Streptomonospora litoralis]